jgi:hypothetical protein
MFRWWVYFKMQTTKAANDEVSLYGLTDVQDRQLMKLQATISAACW